MTEQKTEGPIISATHTTCRNCVFAEFKDKVQVACRLHKIQDYRDAGIEVLEVFDDDVEFFLINGRFCLFYRNEQIMERHPRNTWEKITKLTTKVPYHVLVFFEEYHSFPDIKKILQKLENQEIPPNLVTVINKQYTSYSDAPDKYVKPSLLLELLGNCKFHQYNLKNIYNIDLSDRAIIDLVFDGAGKLPYPFYVTFRAGFDVPLAFSAELNNAVLIKMMQIGVGSPVDDLNGMIVNRTAHKKHGGNAFGIHLEDKIAKYEENAHKFLYEAVAICPSLKTK